MGSPAVPPSAVADVKQNGARNIPKKGSLLLKGEHLYMVADNGVASCLVAATGEVLWSERLNAGDCSPILCWTAFTASAFPANVSFWPLR